MPKTKAQRSKRRDRREIPAGPGYSIVSQPSMSPIAPRLVTQLAYADIVRLGITTGIQTEQIFRLNSPYDPDFSGSGHQAKGFDQLAAMYNRYRVYKTSYDIWFTVTGTADQPALCVTFPSNSSVTTTDANSTVENWQAKWGYATFQQPLHLKGTVDLPTLNGKSLIAYGADDTTQSEITTNPGEGLFLHCCASNNNAASVSIDVKVRFVMHVEFSDPTQLAVS